MTTTGLVATGDPTYTDWSECGEWLKRAEKAVGFWIGDWLNYGERKWGEMYAQAMEETGLDYQTLRNYKATSANVDLYLRKDNLSFTHHATVAPLAPEEQRMFLEAAAPKNGDKKPTLTVEELKKEIKAHKKRKRLAELPDPPKYVGAFQLDSIQVADIHDLDLPRASVNMIFTDPPYHDEYLDLYGALAELAAHVLKEGAYLMTYVGKMFMPTIINTMEANGLEYIWTFCVFQPDNDQKINKHHLFEAWRPILAFKKPGDTATREWQPDAIRGTRDKSYHEWQQQSEPALKWIGAYTQEGDIVLDPFIGGGTTASACKQIKRHYLAFDVDPESVKMASENVRLTN